MKKNIITLVAGLLILTLIISCAEKNENRDLRIIDIAGAIGKGKIIGLSEIASDVTYIPLETNDSSIVGNINSIQYERGQIYVVHGTNKISLFDDKGKFVRNINRCGRGPIEYVGLFPLNSLDIDINNGNLLALSIESALYEYTEKGEFVRKIQVPEINGTTSKSFNWILKIRDNCYISSIFKDNKSYTVIYDSLLNIKVMFPISQTNNDEITGIISESKFNPVEDIRFMKFEDKVRIVYSYPDIIQSLDKNLKIDTAYIINYGPYKVTRENRKDMQNQSAKIINLINLPFESKNYLFVWLNLRAMAHDPVEYITTNENGMQITKNGCTSYALFNKNTGEFILMNQPSKGKQGFRDDIGGGPVFWPKNVSSQGYLVAAHSAANFKDFAENQNSSDKVKKLAAKINEFDNPIIALVKLK